MGYLGSKAISPHLQGWVDKYNLTTFVETGLEDGRSLSHVTRLTGLEKFISIEIDYKWIEKAQTVGLEHYDTGGHKQLNDSIELLHGSSVDMLPQVLDTVEGNVLWWLDAHVPKAGGTWSNTEQSTVEDVLDRQVAFPLEEELGIIMSSRDISNDVFLCDDLRVYDQGSWKKIFADRGYGDTGSSDFISVALGPTHTVRKDRSDSIYLIALPKDVEGQPL